MINYNQVIYAVTDNNRVIKATKFISPTKIVRATRKLFGKKIVKDHNIEITLTIGKPNYAERELIKLFKKAKEPFPIKMIQLKLYNAKKAKVVGKKK